MLLTSSLRITRSFIHTVCAVVLTVFAGTVSAATPMIYVGQDTFLKSSTAQASSLPAASKCAFARGQAFQINAISDGGAEHFKVTLPRAYTGCALTTGYIYSPHVSTNSTAITVNVSTVFKKSTANSSALPAASKCTMPTGVYGLSSAAVENESHFKVNLKSFLPNCSFSQGYIFDGHASNSIQQLSLADSVYLKKSTADSSTLPSSDKCLLAKGNYVLTAAPGTNGEHYSVSLASNPSGCGFKNGFVFYALTYLAKPGGTGPAPSSGYTKPLENGVAGGGNQAWCVCRNIGTSPHIGQDWNASGAERSVAIANGTIADKGFSSACGHTITLRDSGGANWIYRHLNSNSIQEGQTVSKGQFLANHSTYPVSGAGCGAGAHLHIERRSAGSFNDNAVFKSCEAGPEPCNYDPNKPFNRSAVSDGFVTDAVASQTDAGGPKYCRTDPSSYPVVEARELVEYTDAEGLNVVAKREWLGEQARLTAAVSLPGNPSNSCTNEQNCITAWSVLSVNSNGTQRIFHDAAVRNRAAAIVAEEEHCLASETQSVIVLVKDRHGARYQVPVPLGD